MASARSIISALVRTLAVNTIAPYVQYNSARATPAEFGAPRVPGFGLPALNASSCQPAVLLEDELLSTDLYF